MKIKFMLIASGLLGYLTLTAQDMPADVDLGFLNPYPYISSMLLEVNDRAQESLSNGIDLATRRNMLVKEDRIYVEFVRGSETDTDLSIDNSFLQSLPGVEITTTFVNRTSAWVRPDQLLSTAQALPPDYRISEVVILQEDNEGPGLTNSDSYAGPEVPIC